MSNAALQNQLQPLKLVLHGPPASGKTKLAIRICQRYGAHYVSVKTMIEETLDELQKSIEHEEARMKEKKSAKYDDDMGEEEVEETEEEDDEILGDIGFYQEQIRYINNLMAKSSDRKLPDDYIVKMMRDFLSKDVCQNKGYVLDGFPKTIEQAKELFGQAAVKAAEYEEHIPEDMKGEDYMPPEDADIGKMIGNASTKIMPLFVISLQGHDDLLCERLMNMPQREIQGTHFDEVNMLRRLANFRRNNNEDDTVLRFFDETNIHPILIDLEDENGVIKSLEDIFEYITSLIGPPIPGFGLSLEEEEEVKRLEVEQRRLQEEADRIERQLLEEKATKEYEEKMEQWAETFQKLQREEEKLLAAQSEPLRQYLMKYIFPTLSKGLIEVAKIKPEDPVDFLAEFLFKENPEGRMFDPSYTREGEKILEDVDQHVTGIHRSS